MRQCRFSKWLEDKLRFQTCLCSGSGAFLQLYLAPKCLQFLSLWEFSSIVLELREWIITFLEYQLVRCINWLLLLFVSLFTLCSMLALKSSKKLKLSRLRLNISLHVLKKTQHFMMSKTLMRWFQKSLLKYKLCKQVLEKKLLKSLEPFLWSFYL